MFQPFIALVQVPQRGMVMMPVVAEDAAQALQVTGQLCVNNGQADAMIVGLFDEKDAANLTQMMDQAKATAQDSR